MKTDAEYLVEATAEVATLLGERVADLTYDDVVFRVEAIPCMDGRIIYGDRIYSRAAPLGEPVRTPTHGDPATSS